MKYYIIAGEASGDLHGASLIKALLKKDPTAEFRCWGGEKMADAGAELVVHYKDLAFMGFTEVLMNLRSILKNFSFCKRDIFEYQPDAVIFIDYPGFNLRMAKWASIHHFKTIYYISPQLWAWNSRRVRIVRKYIDKMLCILPFEKAFYAKFGIQIEYVGHPLLRQVGSFAPTHDFIKEHPWINREFTLLMPGSRKQEIKRNLPLMKKLAQKHPGDIFVIAGLSHIAEHIYFPEKNSQNLKNIKLIYDRNYNLLSKAHSAIVCSGTATLETAMFNVPQIVIYKGSPLSYQIARRVIKVPNISLVNLILERESVVELIQAQANIKSLTKAYLLLNNVEERKRIKNDYTELRYKLGKHDAPSRSAEIIVDFLSENADEILN